MGYRILVVDDELKFTATVRQLLEAAGFEVEVAARGDEALRKIDAQRPDLVLLDYFLNSRIDGRDVLEVLARRMDSPPVITISINHDAGLHTQALNTYASDSLTKPFDNEQLVARIHAVLRRSPTLRPLPSRFVAGPLTYDDNSGRAHLDGAVLDLSPYAARLLRYLMVHHGEMLSRQRLLSAIWGTDMGGDEVLSNRIAEIRKTLGSNEEAANYIKTTYSRGAHGPNPEPGGYTFIPDVVGEP
jgi:DNA-binding response OmpR family regulator